MEIGIPKERKKDETRVALQTDQVRAVYVTRENTFIQTSSSIVAKQFVMYKKETERCYRSNKQAVVTL
jgi:alanine dehydrogenase